MIIKTTATVASLMLFLVVIEAGYFYWMFDHQDPLKKADLIVVFAGDDGRIDEGYSLAKSGLGDNLAVSPASLESLKLYGSKYGKVEPDKIILENKARTTFENAYYARKIIENHRFKSVILVTSTYHIPRSYALLKIALAGTGTKIQIHGVGDPKPDRSILLREMIKLWASFGEFLYSTIAGGLPARHPKSYLPI
jgi:uncharacterized SAM-binding protein YcdF (DUF218 family)